MIKFSFVTEFSTVRAMHPPQNNAIVPSEFEKFWKQFTRVFQILCVSHYSVYRPRLRNSFIRSLPFLLYFVAFASIHITFLTLNLMKGIREGHEQPFMKRRESPLMFYINCLSIFGTFATHITTHLETLISGKRENEIHQKLKKINEIFASKLNYVIDYKARRIRYVRKTVSVFVFAWLLSAGSSLIRVPISNHDKYFNQPILILAVTIIRSRGCHIALFLNTIADILKDLQFLLRQQQIQSHQRSGSPVGINYKRENIRYLREIYSNVWLVSNVWLSDCFGWSLITFLIEFSIEVINSSYWVYINLNLYGSNSLNIHIMLYNGSIAVVFWYYCMLSERCQNMGKAVTKALHTPSNYHDANYQRFVRIFSLQIKEQPIKITMKQMFTYNHSLLKSTIVLVTTYVAIVIQFQISEEKY